MSEIDPQKISLIEDDLQKLGEAEERLRGFIADQFHGERTRPLIGALMVIAGDLMISSGMSKKSAVAQFADFIDILEAHESLQTVVEQVQAQEDAS